MPIDLVSNRRARGARDLLRRPAAVGQAPTNVHQAVLGEPNQPTAEVSTDELRRILAEQTAFVFDARPLVNLRLATSPVR